jgi:hypothetical protein
MKRTTGFRGQQLMRLSRASALPNVETITLPGAAYRVSPSRTHMSRQSRSPLARTRDRRTREDTCENPRISSKLAKEQKSSSLLKRVLRQPNQREEAKGEMP